MDATRFLDSLREARSELGAAISQTLPTDDRINAGHVSNAHAILKTLIQVVEAEQRAPAGYAAVPHVTAKRSAR